MLRVILESPFAGDTVRNIIYARRAVADSISRREAPIASHLLYTQPNILDDRDPEARELGIKCGFAWLCVAHRMVVYQDLGISPGMEDAIKIARLYNLPVEYRNIDDGQVYLP